MSSRIESAGITTDVKKTDNGLIIQTDNCTLHIRLHDHNVVRFCYKRGNEPLRDFSYSVSGKEPEKINFEVTESKTQLRLQTESLIIDIEKVPIRISIYNLDGQLINGDDRELGVSWIGTEITAYKQLLEGERFIGLGEKTGHLNRRGKAYTNWNTDNFAYSIEADPLYCSTPFYIGIHKNGCYGIFFDNSHRTMFNFGASNHRFSSFGAEDGDMNYYFMYSPNNQISELLNMYGRLTGFINLPPIWSLGFQQCRYSYYPENNVRTLAQKFRDNDIPCDMLYLDIHYMDKYKVFTWDNERFPNPKALLHDLDKMNFKLALIFNPGIKAEAGYAPYDKGQREKVFLQYADKQNYEADVWPGTCCLPDFTNPITRQWWGRLLRPLMDDGLLAFWNDMNEPATWGQTVPNNIVFEFDGHRTTHREARNVYALLMARATYESYQQYSGTRRPFILSRAGFSGIQRYAAIWTGDNVSSDEHMLLGVRMVNSLGLAGIPFAGYDVGGFAGDATPELFARWISIAAFTPFFRSHSMINSKEAEPWSFGEEVLEIARNYIKLRYRLMPYIYSLFYEASQTAMPIARSLAIYDPQDPLIYKESYENEYLFGPAFLVVPVSSKIQITKAYLPKGKWYDFYTDKMYDGNAEIYIDTPKERLPLFVKASSIVPMQSNVPSLTTRNEDFRLYLHLYNGNEDSSFVLYEDDGETYKHEQKDYKFVRTISFDAENKKLTFGAGTGKMATRFMYITLYLHGFGSDLKGAKINNGRVLKINRKDFRHLKPISNFDPFENRPPDTDFIANLPSIELNCDANEMNIEFLYN